MSKWRKAHPERHRETTRQYLIANAEKLRDQRRTRRKPRPDLSCVQCGATFTPKAAHSKICSDECRKARSKVYERNRPPRVIDRKKANKRLRRWRKANPEKVCEQKRRARTKNPEKTREQDRRWRAARSGKQPSKRSILKRREGDRRRYAANPEKARQTRKRSYHNNIEAERAKARDRARWYAAHPEYLATKHERDRKREDKRRSRDRNSEASQETDRRYREKNRKKERERSRRNRAAKKDH